MIASQCRLEGCFEFRVKRRDMSGLPVVYECGNGQPGIRIDFKASEFGWQHVAGKTSIVVLIDIKVFKPGVAAARHIPFIECEVKPATRPGGGYIQQAQPLVLAGSLVSDAVQVGGKTKPVPPVAAGAAPDFIKRRDYEYGLEFSPFC